MRIAIALAALLAATPGMLHAQKDWYNLDRGRPFRVEDARALERRALELSLVPLDWEGGGAQRAAAHAEATLGILPRTQVALGLEGAWDDATAGTAGLAGAELGVLHALNVETLGWPAIAVRADLHAPLGGLGGEAWVGSLGLAITRTLGRVRLHASGAADLLLAGAGPGESRERWAGLALDYALPLDATLFGAEAVWLDPGSDADGRLEVGVGARRQLGPRTLAHAGLHYRTRDDAWRLAAGFAYALGI